MRPVTQADPLIAVFTEFAAATPAYPGSAPRRLQSASWFVADCSTIVDALLTMLARAPNAVRARSWGADDQGAPHTTILHAVAGDAWGAPLAVFRGELIADDLNAELAARSGPSRA